jgi:streptomycin 6-kinase
MAENFTSNLPKRFVRNTIDLCGAAGEGWLNDLPQILAELSKIWSLEVEKPFANLSYNFVAACVCENENAVLKIALPLDNPEIHNEARFLQTANGRGAVRLLKSNEARRAMLLERAAPGANLKEVFHGKSEKAVDIATKTIRAILREAPEDSTFQQLDDWYDNFFTKAENTNFPFQNRKKTREFYEELSHGDLHHENILSATRESFLAIDPKGIVGDVGYEISVFLNNHLRWLNCEPDVREKLNAAIQKFSEAFAIEPKDLRKWAYAQKILSAWWTFEDNGKNWESELAFAEFWEV